MTTSSLNKNLKAACAATAVATCWGVGQQAQALVVIEPMGISGTISPTTKGLTHVYLFYASNASGFMQNFALPDAPAGVTTSYFVNAALTGSPETYTIMGVYDKTAGLISISLGGINAIGNSFDATFDSPGFDFTEATIASALISGNLGQGNDAGSPAQLAQTLSFNQNGYGTFNVTTPKTGEVSTLISFSDGALDGSAFAAVPEPGAAGLVGLGGLVLLFRRRGK